MEAFEYYNPVKVIYGEGSVSNVGQYTKLYGKKALIVTYTNVDFFLDLIDEIHKSLNEQGLEYIDYMGATANPTLEQARKGIELCKNNNVDVIIGLGGGSAMDCAKVIAAGVLYKHGDIRKMISFSHSNTVQIPPKEALPMIMIPTLPATGSEMNPTAVITDEKTVEKSYVWSPECLYPKVSLLDPSTTVSLPAFQTACGSIDIIAHILESYFNGTGENLDVQDRMQEGVIKAVFDNIRPVLQNPTDKGKRGIMMWAASIALNGWLLSGTYTWAPMHQMGHVLSARYNATHGATLATMIIAWMKFYSNHENNERFVQFAKRVFDRSLEDTINYLETEFVELGVPTKISEFGVKNEDIDSLVDVVEKVSFNDSGVLGSNPALTKEEIKEIYLLAL